MVGIRYDISLLEKKKKEDEEEENKHERVI